jgi:hypothetical protein
MASDKSAEFACTCGAVRGRVTPATRHSGTHVMCYCADCRAAQIYLGQDDPAPEGVELFQTTPDTIAFERGQDRLGLMRLGPNGLMRWYATCCNAPLFNTLKGPKLPFVGIHVARIADPAPIGPILVRGFMPQPDGSRKHKRVAYMAWQMFTRMLAARLSGRWRQTPFFDIETGAPVAKARIPGKNERAALYRNR